VIETEVLVPAGGDLAAAERVVESCCARQQLRLTLKGTLSRYPGCIHWHYKRGRERGTLELTWWPRGRRLWIAVQNGRTGEWIEAAAAELKAILERREAWEAWEEP